MAVSPFRALLAAHAQATWNQSARELGRQGRWALVLTVGLLGTFGAGMLLVGSAAVGWIMGGAFGKPHVPLLLGGLLSLASLGAGLAGGVLGGARQLTWEAYRGYPLRLPTLYGAELLAGLGDLLPLVAATVTGGLLAGLGLRLPSLLLLAPLVWLETVLTLLALQLLVEGLAAALLRRLKLLLFALLAALWLGTTLLGGRLPAREDRRRGRDPLSHAQVLALQAAARRVGEGVALLPAGAAARSLAEARDGRWGAALAAHAYPLATLLLLMAAGAQLMKREAEGARPRDRGTRADRLWSFRHPVQGLARLHFLTLMKSHMGRFAFLMPLLTIVLLKGPLAQLKAAGSWTVPAAFAYLSLVGNNFVFNQFGLDRHGVKALLLLPVPPEALLQGKLLGMAAHQGLQALLLALLLGLLDQAAPVNLACGILLMGCIFLAQASVGQWTSTWSPRPLALDSLKNNNMPFLLGLLSLGTSALWSSAFGGLYALLAWLAPAWLLPGMAAAFGLTLALHLRLIPAAARVLDQRREKLVEALG